MALNSDAPLKREGVALALCPWPGAGNTVSAPEMEQHPGLGGAGDGLGGGAAKPPGAGGSVRPAPPGWRATLPKLPVTLTRFVAVFNPLPTKRNTIKIHC